MWVKHTKTPPPSPVLGCGPIHLSPVTRGGVARGGRGGGALCTSLPQVQGLGGQPQDGPGADHAVVDCPVSLGLSVAEERAQLTFTQEPVKLHPGVRVIGVDPSVADSSLEVGDIITKVSYTVPIGTSADFRRVVHRMCPGDLVMVHVAKEGGERVYPIIAGGCPPASGPDASV